MLRAGHLQLVLLALIAVVLTATCVTAATTPTIYVSPSGNDSWSGGAATKGAADRNGTVAGPLRTLAAAVQVARSRYGSGVAKTVRVAAGSYMLSSSLSLSAADSNITFIAEDARSGKTIISGGQYIPASAFKALDTSTALGGRVPTAARSHVRQANLTQLGLTAAQLGALASNAAGMELFFKGDALHLARWPNYQNYVLTGNVTDHSTEKSVFPYLNATSWPTYSGVWVHGFFGQNWFDERRAIASVDETAKTITLAAPTNYAFKRGMRFYYYNVIDELDTAGEYLIDRDTGVLYFYPPSTIASNTDAVLSVLTQSLIVIDGSNVTFSGFTLEATQGAAVKITGSGNVIKNCVIRNVGNKAVDITGGTNNVVMTSELYNMGTMGVNMQGGNRNSLTPSNHMAFANHVHDFSRFILCYNPAFLAGGVGAKIVNNKIHTAPHNAILLGLGNNIEIYFNEIYDMCREASDVGAFYQGRDWTSQGSYISYNYFHDIHGFGTEGVSAIYFDDENSGSTAFGNIIVNMEKGILMGGGRSNHVNNNIFINITDAAYNGDARGLPDQTPQNNDTLYPRLLAMPYTTAPWSTEYPELVGILQDPVSPHAPRYNSYRHNVACNAKNMQRLSAAASPYIANVTSDNWWVKNSTTCEKAIFPDLAGGSLEIRSNAPFLSSITFSAIPWRRIGLEGAYEPLPSNLPGLRYGSIVTPQEEAVDSPAPSGPSAFSLAIAVLRWTGFV